MDSDASEQIWRTRLGSWRLSVERANRHNRNVLQYGAAIAALFGIGAGSGGVLALAKAVKPGSDALIPDWLLFVALLLAAVVGIGLAVLLYKAFRGRVQAERDADRLLGEFIEVAPKDLLPKP